MKVLVVGNGGREHCLVWKLAQSQKVEKIFCTGENAGIARLAEIVPMSVAPDFDEIIRFVEAKGIDLTLVGPEAPLAGGIVDAFESRGLQILGPRRDAARIESSKSFAKSLMLEAGIPTGRAESFTDADAALRYLKSLPRPVPKPERDRDRQAGLDPPCVIKADGLAAGKGVFIAEDVASAEKNIRDNLERRIFGDSSRTVLIEEFLRGEEASLIAFTDGESVVPMVSAQDHKPIYDGDRGPNTGGMGSYSPAPLITRAIHKHITEEILKPAVRALRKRGIRYKGVLYAGVIVTDDGPKVLEFNCRFGDPETQSMLPLMESDLVEVALAVVEERLGDVTLRWKEKSAVCVVMASGGYPGDYEKGKTISGLDEIAEDENTIVFHAGTKREGGKIVTNGGRVLGLTTLDADLPRAIARNYELIERIRFDGCQYRRDIGFKALKRVFNVQ
jgi:phosphoribosylamine--glycine ligase